MLWRNSTFANNFAKKQYTTLCETVRPGIRIHVQSAKISQMLDPQPPNWRFGEKAWRKQCALLMSFDREVHVRTTVYQG